MKMSSGRARGKGQEWEGLVATIENNKTPLISMVATNASPPAHLWCLNDVIVCSSLQQQG